MSAKILLPFAGTITLLLTACTSDRVLPTAPFRAVDDSTGLDISAAASGSSVTGPIGSGVSLANVCLDIRGGTAAAPAAGAPLQAWRCHGGANQQFTLETTGAITAYGGQLCLAVAGGEAEDGDLVVAAACAGGVAQRWTLTAAGQIQTAVNGKCLDLWGAKGENGAPIKVWSCHGGSNQTWGLKGSTSIATDSSTVGSAALPRTYLNTAMPAVTGRTINVSANGNLQDALDAAQPGDEIVLPAGAIFEGNFVLPVKNSMTSTQWITVRSAGAIPTEGTRVGPRNAAQMPKILTPNNWGPAIATAPGAQGWRLTGLEISYASGQTWNYSLVNFGTAGSGQSTTSQVPSRIVLDRSYVHGSSSFDLRHCMALNSAASAVIDSYLADCHARSNDSQAIIGWNGPGPYKIANNYLEAGHEVIMFGGNDPTLSGNIPSDIEIRRNYITRPSSWKGVWQVKNLFELKAGQRLLVEGNVFENNWVDAQNGFAILFNSNNQDGGCTWCVVADVTFRSNVLRNIPQGFNITDHGSNGTTNPSRPTQRITIYNNVITGVSAAGGRLYQINGALAGITIANNSGFGGSQDVYFVTPDEPLPSFVYRNNVTGGSYTLFADGGYMGQGALTQLGIPSASVTGNVIYSGSGSRAVPPGNSYVSSIAAIGLRNLAGGDLTLSSSSPYLTSGTNGTLPGANMTVVSQLTSGVAQ